MTLAGGTKLGRYEIRSQLGAGGMGEVYRAFDPNVNREVAIKVLPVAYFADKDRLARFEQEAQAAGSLNHPNILTIHHIEAHDAAPYIVSELLEGETLRERMGGVALPQRKAIDYALQTAHGLAAAHEKGIIHRDLKPDNIFITKDGRVKILDFGLAKLLGTFDGTQSQTEVPTRRVDTDPGVVMGTVGYMSPEQLRGKPADHRSDIFSFGAILYEMLSGRRAFRGETTADTMSAILREDPPELSATNKNVNPALERVVNHCLEKNPEERFHSARDLAFAIGALSGSAASSESTPTILATFPPTKRKLGELIAWTAAALFLIAAVVFAVLYFRRVPVNESPTRFVVAMPERVGEISAPVVSPDGRSIAFLGTSEGNRFIYVRTLDSLNAQRLTGTEDALGPFWSPDSRYLAFFSNNKLKKVAVTGGSPQVLSDAPRPTGGAWNQDNVIVFGLENDGIRRIPAVGGSATSVLKLDDSRKESIQSWPSFLPDGHHFLYHSWTGRLEDSAVCVASLDGSQRKVLLKNDSNAAYADPGYLLFARDTTLMAQPFDASKLELSGEPFPVAESVSFTPAVSYSNFSVSKNGVLTFWDGNSSNRQLTWFERDGKKTGVVGVAGTYNDVVLSPDEKTAAVQRLDGGNSDVWLMDLARGVPSRFTFHSASDDDPVWSPDGKLIVFTSTRDGSVSLYRKASNGTGNEELLYQTTVMNDGIDWSNDGRFILFGTQEKSGTDLWVLPLFGERKAYPVLQSEFNEGQGRFSPDGKWFAYTSNETGRIEVYVTGFLPPGGKWQVSATGGAQPHWRKDGRELFYIASDRKLMVVDVRLGSTFEMGPPTALFETQVARYDAPNRYAVSRDGQRFLINCPTQEVSRSPITVVMNWTAGLQK